MIKTLRRLLLIFVCMLVLSIPAAGCDLLKTNTQEEAKPAIPVRRGNLAITVSVDGNLVMPQAFDLSFGAPGTVQDVLVEEGDQVKAGTVLATLDHTLQTLDIQSANNSLQNVLSNLYETVPRFPQFPNKYYTTYTLNTTALDPSTGLPFTYNVYDSNPEDTPITEPFFTPIPALNPAHEPITVYLPPPGGTSNQYLNVEQVSRDSKVSYPFYYPNRTALTSFVWAQQEVDSAQDLLQASDYSAALSELQVAVSDLDVCIKIFDDAIYGFESGLGHIMRYYDDENMYLPVVQDPSIPMQVENLQNVAELVKQAKADIEKIQALITEANYAEADSALGNTSRRMREINEIVTFNAGRIEKKNNTTIYGRDISFYLYDVAEEKLNVALKGVETGGLDSPDLSSNLRIARHYMEICNAILGSNDYVLKHGLSLKSEHQYNIDLENALITLENRKENFLDTIILAPFDGTVVSVGAKKNDVLSSTDYSSKGTIQLVDTSQVKFQGTVDEIDILKIKTGQKATLSVDAIPGKVFAGTVSFISPYGEASTSNVVKFNVTILLDPTDVELKGGLTATADIAVSSVEDVLLLPLSAISTTPEGSFVTVVNEATGRAEKRQVTLGIQNLQFAEVKSGLKEGDMVEVQEMVIGAPVTQRQFGPPPPR